MRKYIVNDQEVEYLYVKEREDGALVVHFEEKFNLLNAHHSEIMRRLRDNQIEGCHVFKFEIKYKIIVIKLKTIEQLTGALHSLDVPFGCYEVEYANAEIIIDTPKYDELVGSVGIVSNEKNVEEECL